MRTTLLLLATLFSSGCGGEDPTLPPATVSTDQQPLTACEEACTVIRDKTEALECVLSCRGTSDSQLP